MYNEAVDVLTIHPPERRSVHCGLSLGRPCLAMIGTAETELLAMRRAESGRGRSEKDVTDAMSIVGASILKVFPSSLLLLLALCKICATLAMATYPKADEYTLEDMGAKESLRRVSVRSSSVVSAMLSETVCTATSFMSAKELYLSSAERVSDIAYSRCLGSEGI